MKKVLSITGMIFVASCFALFLFHIAVAVGECADVIACAEQKIQQNQVRIAELKPAVDEFETLKIDNAKNVGVLELHGKTYDWSQNTVVDFQ